MRRFQKYYSQYDNKSRTIHCTCCNPYGSARAAKPAIRKLARRKSRQQLRKMVFLSGSDQ